MEAGSAIRCSWRRAWMAPGPASSLTGVAHRRHIRPCEMYRRVIRSARPASLRRLRLSKSAALGALLLCVAPAAVRAQGATTGVIVGTVVDDSTGAALPRVTVLVLEPSRGTLTDERGRFALTG